MEDPDETDRAAEYALRYLKLLTSWNSAVIHLLGRKWRWLRDARITLVKLVEEPRVSDGAAGRRAIDVLMNAIDAQPESSSIASVRRARVKSWVLSLKGDVSMERSCYIHAEAGLMALAFDVFRSPEKHVDRDYAMAFRVSATTTLLMQI